MELSMAALIIQNKEDILAAYLKTFGFVGKKADVLTAALLQKIPEPISKNGEELIAYADKIILKVAKNIFKNAKLADEQLLAQFKLCFLLCSGAEKCTLDNLKKIEFSADLVEQMKKHFVINAPQYHMSVMKPQKIENFRTKKKKK